MHEYEYNPYIHYKTAPIKTSETHIKMSKNSGLNGNPCLGKKWVEECQKNPVQECDSHPVKKWVTSSQDAWQEYIFVAQVPKGAGPGASEGMPVSAIASNFGAKNSKTSDVT